MRTIKVCLPLILVAAALLGCSSEPLRVTLIQLGRSLNADSTVANNTTVFAPGDTVYVSVHTSGVGSATIGVRWKFGSRVVGEPTKQVSYKDDAATEFHMQSATGFPQGEYSVEILLDGQPVETRTFRVEEKR